MADLYEQYNVMKYIESVSMGSTTFDFDSRLKQEKEQFINRLPGGIAAQIKKYIEDSRKDDDSILKHQWGNWKDRGNRRKHVIFHKVK